MKILTKEEKKSRLMETALELFIQNGMSKTTISQITAKADIGKSTFYEYFKNKEDVINLWFSSFFEELRDVEKKISNIKTNKEKIITIAKLSCANEYCNDMFISTFLEFWKLAFNDKNETSIKLLKTFYKEFSILLETLLERGIKEGEFKEFDVKKASSSIIAMIDGHWIQYMVNEDYDIESYITNSIEVFLNGVKND